METFFTPENFFANVKDKRIFTNKEAFYEQYGYLPNYFCGYDYSIL